MNCNQTIRKSEYILNAKYIAVLRLRLDEKKTIQEIRSLLKISTKTIYKIFRCALKEYPSLKESLSVKMFSS